MSDTSTTVKLADSFDIWSNSIIDQIVKHASTAISQNKESKVSEHFHSWYQWPGTHSVSKVAIRKILNYLQSYFVAPLNRDVVITYKSDIIDKICEGLDAMLGRKPLAWSFYPGNQTLALIIHDAVMDFVFNTPIVVVGDSIKVDKSEHKVTPDDVGLGEVPDDKPDNYRLHMEVIAPTILDYVTPEDELLVRRICDSVRRAIQLNKPLTQND